ncbi:MAG: sigma-70 family RNA polymerase sigma factor [Gemmataceae bacterium]|nr:sigma-70 family RNA polymerase sigma factor [Gemmataceae bacterium]MDW8264014.1 sigma-70 family RNA polymerase sigma factor [Gemmataceae bacterium]
MPTSFSELMQRVRAGDEDAAARLVRAYEPDIRRAVRLPLAQYRLQHLVDENDICQGVLARFFAHVVLGKFELEQPDDLRKLLLRMARNLVTDEARTHLAGRRDVRRHEEVDLWLETVPDRGTTPSKIVAGRELLAEIHRRLSPEERYLAEQRQLGRTWDELAAACGSTPAALRKRLDRAIDRVTSELGLRGECQEE